MNYKLITSQSLYSFTADKLSRGLWNKINDYWMLNEISWARATRCLQTTGPRIPVEEQTFQDPRQAPRRRSWKKLHKISASGITFCAMYTLYQILPLTYFYDQFRWIAKLLNITVRDILPAAIYLTGVSGEWRFYRETTYIPSHNFSTAYIWDLFHIFVYMNW